MAQRDIKYKEVQIPHTEGLYTLNHSHIIQEINKENNTSKKGDTHEDLKEPHVKT
jgi:hypothetical protein